MRTSRSTLSPGAGETLAWAFDKRIMKNPASIVGLVLPSILCVGLTLAIKQELHANESGEAAAGLIAGGTFALLALLVISCIINLVCLTLAARRKESWWKLSSLGFPLCVASTVITAVLIK